MTQQNAANWLQRNWKWLLPVGCLTLLAVIAAFVLGVVFLVFRLIRSSDVYQQALDRARQSPTLIEALGPKIDDGYFMSGHLNENMNASGSAQMTIPLSGSKGNAVLHVEASKSRGVWTFSKLDAEIESTKQEIDVLHDAR